MFAHMRAAAHAAAFVVFSAAVARHDATADARVLFDRYVAGLPRARVMDCDRARQAMDYRARRAAALSERKQTPADMQALSAARERRANRSIVRGRQVASGGWMNASRALSGC